MVATLQKCPKTLEHFVGGSWGIEAATDDNSCVGAFLDTLIYRVQPTYIN